MNQKTLLKYDTPVGIFTSYSEMRHPACSSPQPPASASPLPPSLQERQEILNDIFPPREWMEGNQLLVQQVSSIPSTKEDLVRLTEQLDKMLQKVQERGLSPATRAIYSQCFDELIRQVTINCTERGSLMLRVRDEAQATIVAYETLYYSSVAFGLRKALRAEQRMADMENRIEELEKEKEDLIKQLNKEKAKTEEITKRIAEEEQMDEEKHAEAVESLTAVTQQLKTQLEMVAKPKEEEEQMASERPA